MSQRGTNFSSNSQNQYKLPICEKNMNADVTQKQREMQQLGQDLASNRQPQEAPKIVYDWVTVGPARFMTVYRGNVPVVPVLVLEKLFLKALDRTMLSNIWSSIVFCDSSYMSEPEVWLFNWLIQQHCPFSDLQRLKFDTDDRVVSLKDAEEFAKIVTICNRQMLLNHNFRSLRFGYVQLSGTWVPYVVIKGERLFPAPLLEYQMRTLALPHSYDRQHWDLAYLKLALRLIGEGELLNCLDFCPCISESQLKEVCERNGVGFKPKDGWPVSRILRAIPAAYPGYSIAGFVWTKMPPTQKHKLTAEWYRRKVVLKDR